MKPKIAKNWQAIIFTILPCQFLTNHKAMHWNKIQNEKQQLWGEIECKKMASNYCHHLVMSYNVHFSDESQGQKKIVAKWTQQL
jgi:hypothetical protein